MQKFLNQELQDRYENDNAFRRRVEQSESDYAGYLKKAEGKTLDIHEEILQRFLKEGSEAIYFFYGYLQPSPGTKTSDLSLAFLKYFQPDSSERFIFVYFNNETSSSEYYFQFKKILALLPLGIMQRLHRFILVKPYFYIKAFDYLGLGSINRIFNSRYITVDSCTELLEHLKISVQDFVTFVPEEISQEFPKLLKRRPSLMSYRINLEGQNMTEEQRRDKKEFENAISALITKEIYKLQNYEIGDIGIPVIIQLLIHYFRTKPQGLDEEGIFRKSVSIDEENETLNQLSKRNYEYLEQIKNPHLIASLIKKFFSNLKEPIILFQTYETLLHDQGIKDKRGHVKKQITALPKLNFITLAFLIEFLKKDVLPHENKSKMSANNLAICFSPSLMRSEKPSMADLINASKSVAITNILINDFQQIFGNQKERELMYKKNIRSRDINFKENIKKQLDIARNSEEEEFAFSISITEPTQLSEEIKIQPKTEGIQLDKNVYKQDNREVEKNPRESRMRLPIFGNQQGALINEQTLKREPPDSSETPSVIEDSSIRSRSADRKSIIAEQKPIPNILSSALRATIKFKYTSRKEIEEDKQPDTN